MTDVIIYRKLSELKLWSRNYRVGNVDAIITSIARFGFNGALRVWRDDTVVAGNHALKALLAMKAGAYHVPRGVVEVDGDWLVPCVDVAHLNSVEVEAFAIADNRAQELGTNDAEQLAALLSDIAAEDDALLRATGYDNAALDALLFELNPSFDPVGMDEQPRLDQKAPIVCPHCGQGFTPGE